MAEVRDPAGFARLRELAESGPAASLADARLAATRIATILACKGGVITDMAVGDCVEMADTQRLVHARGGQKKVDFYLRLHALGVFPADAPATIRAFGMAQGQLTIEGLVDRYRLQCKPVRDLLVDYLRERQPSLDFASLDAIPPPWPACSGPGWRPCPRASARCGCPRRSPAPGRKTC